MKSVMRMRHYCDFCKKSGATKPAMAKHETGCTKNPDRKCRFCELAGFVQLPMPELQRILKEQRFKALVAAVESCPACILAALRQEPPNPDAPSFGTPEEMDAYYQGSFEFDFKEACKEFWSAYNAEQQPYGGY